jgi:hypothetical protein
MEDSKVRWYWNMVVCLFVRLFVCLMFRDGRGLLKFVPEFRIFGIFGTNSGIEIYLKPR